MDKWEIKRAQFTRRDSELHPECDNKEYLDYEKVKTALLTEICSYGYQEICGTQYKWVRKQLAHEHNCHQELVEALENLLQDDCTNCIYNNDKDKCSSDSFNNFPCRIQEAQTTLKKARR